MPVVSSSAVVPVLETAVDEILDGFTRSHGRARVEQRAFHCTAPCLLASVGMRGGVAGVMCVAAPADLCAELAVERFGEPESAVRGEVLAESLLGEIASIAAGSVATSLEPIESTWLTPPAVIASSSHEWDVMSEAHNAAVFNVHGRQVLVAAAVQHR
jgi:CheY-specific phosphatase CheX